MKTKKKKKNNKMENSADGEENSATENADFLGKKVFERAGGRVNRV